MIKVKNRAIGPEGLELEVHYSINGREDMAFIKVGPVAEFMALSKKDKKALVKAKVKELRDQTSLEALDKEIKDFINIDIEEGPQ